MEKEILNIEDRNKEMGDLRSLGSAINANLMAIGFDYVNKISGFREENEIYKIRDDIAFRIRSINYLAELIFKEETELLNKINLPSNDDSFVHRQIFDSILNQKTIFDSTLYNLATIFDYVANLSEFVFLNKIGLKWNGLFNACSHKQNKSFSQGFKDQIIDFHKSFTDHVFSHRSYLIHKGSDIGDYQL